MKIRSLETFRITLPFRFSFAHALASRAESSNLIVKITLENGCTGFGESIPREYVTGETLDGAEEHVLLNYAPPVLDLDLSKPASAIRGLRECFDQLGLRSKPQGASWCALELAVLDALSQLHGLQAYLLIGDARQERIRYGGVIPFGSKAAVLAMLYFYKLSGYGTVKLKVGAKQLEDDIAIVKLARQILGNECIIRVDANCAWTLDQALKAAAAFRPYGVRSYEQPLAADDWDGLSRLSREIEEDVVLDESLCTIEQARALAAAGVCDAFNIRLSKAGGLLAAGEIMNIALAAGLKIHLGAQVGESAILSAAARQLAFASPRFENYEGSQNMFLLKQDICRENLTAGVGGFADLKYAGKNLGLGVSVIDSRLLSMTASAPQAHSGISLPAADCSETVRRASEVDCA